MDTTTIRGTHIHDLRGLDAEAAYEETQCNDDIKHGDILLVDGGVAILYHAWPTMVHGNFPDFHALAPAANWRAVAAKLPPAPRAALISGLAVAGVYL